MRKLLLLSYIIFVLPLQTFADELLDLPAESTDTINITGEPTSIGLLLVRYLIAVIFVVSLLYFTLKFLIRRNEPKYLENHWMNVLDYNYLGNNKGLYLVEINNEGYVLAASENHMTLLTKIDEEEFSSVKKDILVNNEIKEYSFNPFKKKEKESFHNHLKQNIKIAEKYFSKKRD